MHLFFSQSKCEVLQELNDYCNCEEAFQKDGYKITSETRGLIENLQVMKSVKDEWTTFANITQDELQCIFAFADAEMLKRWKTVQFIRFLVSLETSTTLFVGKIYRFSEAH